MGKGDETGIRWYTRVDSGWIRNSRYGSKGVNCVEYPDLRGTLLQGSHAYREIELDFKRFACFVPPSSAPQRRPSRPVRLSRSTRYSRNTVELDLRGAVFACDSLMSGYPTLPSITLALDSATCFSLSASYRALRSLLRCSLAWSRTYVGKRSGGEIAQGQEHGGKIYGMQHRSSPDKSNSKGARLRVLFLSREKARNVRDTVTFLHVHALD